MSCLHLFLTAALAVTPTPAEVQKWLADADSARNAFEEAVIKARATQVSSGQVQGSAEFEIYAKGREKALLVFRDEKNSGRKVLTVGPRMWLIVAGATNPVPITPSQRLLGGASFGDVARLRFASDYTATLRAETETVAGRECRVLDLSSKDPRASYPKVVLRVDPAEHLARKAVFLLASGKRLERCCSRSMRSRPARPSCPRWRSETCWDVTPRRSRGSSTSTSAPRSFRT